jgi:PIF1-like helicase
LRGLNNQQSVIVSDFLESLLAETGKGFYMDGLRGTSKTHGYKILSLISDLKNILTVNVASTGIGATLLPKGFRVNMRADERQQDFADWLLGVGYGIH